MLYFFTLTMKCQKEKVKKKKKMLLKIASKKKNKIPRNKPNQGGERLICRELQNIDKRNRKSKMIQRNVKISCALGLEELIQLK